MRLAQSSPGRGLCYDVQVAPFLTQPGGGGDSGMRDWLGDGWAVMSQPQDLNLLQGRDKDLGSKRELECRPSVRGLLTQSTDSLTLTGNAQASIFPTENPMAPALGPGHLHQARNEETGFPSTPCFLVLNEHHRTPAAHPHGRRRPS